MGMIDRWVPRSPMVSAHSTVKRLRDVNQRMQLAEIRD